MTTEQTAQQLELAAQILRTGHPWKSSPQAPDTDIYSALRDGFEIRPVLATPPDNRPLHNPDNLTAEQVGVGWRLTVANEIATNKKYWHKTERRWYSSSFYDETVTYRLPLSVPWPEPQPDPYAALKKAHAEGKVIQFVDDGDIWRDIDEPNWKLSANEYRIKPKLTFQLPPPPPGMQWHRTDSWEKDDLPQGYRPLLVDELPKEGDECITKPFESEWCENNNWRNSSRTSEACHYRTRRPLTFTHAGKTWTWHRPGDPMPCARLAFVTTLLEDGGVGGTGIRASRSDWNVRDNGDQIIGWRYADEKKTVPLGPEDIKPFTVIRRKGEAQTWHWRTVSYVDAVKMTCGNRGYEWDELASDYERNESITTGKWNPDAWEACHKQIDA